MPCQYETDDEKLDRVLKEQKQVKQELDKLTRLLCDACKCLSTIPHLMGLMPELNAWYEEHKIKDANRDKKAKK